MVSPFLYLALIPIGLATFVVVARLLDRRP
jgi:hypothetical protein